MTQPGPDQRPGADIPRAYNPTDVEPRIYQLWEEGGYFTPKIEPGKDPFVVIMPPPNVTGELHLGHALTAATEDVLIRWHRMMGDPALWLPGKDHAGIATQWVVERQLAQEGTSRTELGRDAFLERVWQWVERYGNTIDEQHKRLGASCDWSRLRFTLDPGPALAVRTTFVNLYNKGLIYRGERIINWCPRCSTALSDLEVEHEEHEGALYHIRYPLAPKDGEADGHVTVATTRPETMLGDTGVAVHPDDQRYSHLVGRNVTLPIIGRAMPIVGDEAIQPEFGTGALKVTPGHDPVDFEIGQRHNLATVTVIGPDGHITAEGGPYEGYERFEARREIVAQLEREGLLEKVEPYNHSVGQCQRCSSVLEPLISVQWFLAVGSTTTRRPSQAAPTPPSPRDASASCPTASAGCTSTGWRTYATGASAASCGGVTAYLCGTAAHVVAKRPRWMTSPYAASAARPTWNRTMMYWTHGSAQGCGPTRHWAGLKPLMISTTSTPRQSWRRGTTSSSSGWPA